MYTRGTVLDIVALYLKDSLDVESRENFILKFKTKKLKNIQAEQHQTDYTAITMTNTRTMSKLKLKANIQCKQRG